MTIQKSFQKNTPIDLFGRTITPLSQYSFDLPVGRLYTRSDVSIPVHVIHGRSRGPVLLVCAAIHGDELNGIEIVRRIITSPWIGKLRGTLIAVPIVNVLGILQHSRYLPDRRDLNRCFPGSETGSLGARVANLFVQEVLRKCDYAIDLHTGAIHRDNLPQIRVHLDNDKAADMARAFGVPVIIDAPIRDGSLRGAGDDLGIPIITYEGGEALRFDEQAIEAGVNGVRNVMQHLNMLPPRKRPKKSFDCFVAKSSGWARAPAGGLFRTQTLLGHRVEKGDLLGIISGPLGGDDVSVVAPVAGIVIGMTHLPLVNEGEALVHLASFDAVDTVGTVVEEFQQELDIALNFADDLAPLEKGQGLGE